MSNIQTTSVKQYKCKELPATITLELDHDGVSLSLTVFLMIFGGAMTLTGVGFILFGPESIYYDGRVGVSFMQFLQAYPSPIATVGFVILALGQLLSNAQSTKENKGIVRQIESHLAFNLEELSDAEKLYVYPLGDDQFEIGIEKIEREGEQETQANRINRENTKSQEAKEIH